MSNPVRSLSLVVLFGLGGLSCKKDNPNAIKETPPPVAASAP